MAVKWFEYGNKSASLRIVYLYLETIGLSKNSLSPNVTKGLLISVTFGHVAMTFNTLGDIY